MAQQKFTPVKLEKGSKVRTATTAEEETNLRFNGWKPSSKKASSSSSSDSSSTK